MTGPDVADALLAADLVREAGSLARRMRGEGLVAEQKSELSDLVTAADRAAERLVHDRLVAERPDDGLLGEEGSARAGSTGREWVVDPVDGTYNCVTGLDWWCSALALRTGPDLADVLLGAVHHPATGATYVGGRDLPTSRDGVPLPAVVDRPLAECSVATYLHTTWHGTEVGEAWGRVMRGVATLRMLGSSSMDATAVADGRVGLVLQHSLPPWDELPGTGLVQGAGGVTARVEAAGVRWFLAGPPTAVAEASALLTGG